MTKEDFELTFGRKTLLYVEKGCYRKLQKVFGDYTLEVVKLYPFVTLRLGDEVLVFDLVNFTINETNMTLFSSMVGIYQTHLRKAVWDATIEDFHSGKRTSLTQPMLDVAKEISKGVNDD
jgi:hypothetical protein